MTLPLTDLAIGDTAHGNRVHWAFQEGYGKPMASAWQRSCLESHAYPRTTSPALMHDAPFGSFMRRQRQICAWSRLQLVECAGPRSRWTRQGTRMNADGTFWREYGVRLVMHKPKVIVSIAGSPHSAVRQTAWHKIQLRLRCACTETRCRTSESVSGMPLQQSCGVPRHPCGESYFSRSRGPYSNEFV